MATQTDALTAIANLLGGTKATSSPGNTAALEAVLAQLQGQDFSGILQSIFQQAAGSIPGLTVAYGNAMGARRGSNSAVQAALNELMSQVTLKGQSQLAAQQQQNLATQAQAAAAIANATKGTTQTQGTNLAAAGKNLLLAQVLSEGYKKGRGLFDSLLSGDSGGGSALSSSPLTLDPNAALQGPQLESAPLDIGGSSFDANSLNFDFSDPSQSLNFDFSGVSDWGSGSESIPLEDTGLWDDLVEFGVFADGGLVGRDNKRVPLESEDDTAEDAAEDLAEVKDQTKFDVGFTRNAQMDVVQALLGAMASRAPGYADGGQVVLAPGGRGSAAKTVQTNTVNRTAANNTVATSPRASLGTQSSSPATGGISTSDVGINGSGSASVGFSDSADPATARMMRNLVNALNLANTTQMASIPGIGAVAGLVGADNRESALGTVASALLGAINPVLGLALAPAIKMAASNAAEERGAAELNAMNNAPGYDDTTAPTLGVDAGMDAGAGIAADDVNAEHLATWGGGGSGGDFGGRFGAFGLNNSAGGWGGGVGNDSSTGGTAQAANGGHIRGPGTGTSDSIPARLSDGEYVIPADVVQKVGVEFFDKMRAALHTPVNQGA